jgi:hypothetical protein
MICGLLVKCAVLIAVIHGLRALARRIGSRGSGLILGLPSSTALFLVLRSQEDGITGAIEMAEASLLGLAAAVAFPLVYAQAIRFGWRLPGAVAAAVAGYLAVASALGYLHPTGAAECLAVALGAILLASYAAGLVALPRPSRSGLTRSDRWVPVFRTAVPAVYVVLVGITCQAASPSWAGLISTFPSISTVVLTVTHLEDGPAEAGRIAKALPPANLSTAAFLTVFRFVCPVFGLSWATFFGYLAALVNLAAVEACPPRDTLRRWILAEAGRHRIAGRWFFTRTGRPGVHTDPQSLQREFVCRRRHHRRSFAPRVEALSCS